MKNCNRIDWAEQAVRGIVSAKERERARRELLDHMEDHMESLMAAGFSAEDAEKHAVFAMGAPEITAKLLRRAHQPVLTRLWQASRWLLGICLMVLFFMGFAALAPLSLSDLFEAQENSDPSPAQYFTQAGFDNVLSAYRYTRTLQPNARTKQKNYTFTATRASVNEHREEETWHVFLAVEVNRKSFLDPWPNLPGYWCMKNDSGSQSDTLARQGTGVNILHVYRDSHEPYTLIFRGVFPQDSKWVDLTYDNGETTFTIPVDLEGGTEYAH